MPNSIADPLSVDHPDYLDARKEYDEIRKLVRNGLHHLHPDHGKCVLAEREMKAAHKLFLRTSLWVEENPNPSGFNLGIVRDIRVANQGRLRDIVIRANSPFHMDKYKTCMEMLQTVLSDELVAMHHIAAEAEEEEIKHHCNQMDSHLAILKSLKAEGAKGKSNRKND